MIVAYRSTIESELLAIINKYDTEIGSRHRTLEELAETYKYDQSERRALEVRNNTKFLE